MSATEATTTNTADLAVADSTIAPPPKLEQVRGRPVSGRTWKLPKQRFTTTTEVPHLKASWEKKQMQKEKFAALKAKQAQAKALQTDEKKALGEKLKRNREQREMNQAKTVTYQIVSTSKVKRMKRNQLKNIMKLADITKR